MKKSLDMWFRMQKRARMKEVCMRDAIKSRVMRMEKRYQDELEQLTLFKLLMQLLPI